MKLLAVLILAFALTACEKKRDYEPPTCFDPVTGDVVACPTPVRDRENQTHDTTQEQ